MSGQAGWRPRQAREALATVVDQKRPPLRWVAGGRDRRAEGKEAARAGRRLPRPVVVARRRRDLTLCDDARGGPTRVRPSSLIGKPMLRAIGLLQLRPHVGGPGGDADRPAEGVDGEHYRLLGHTHRLAPVRLRRFSQLIPRTGLSISGRTLGAARIYVSHRARCSQARPP